MYYVMRNMWKKGGVKKKLISIWLEYKYFPTVFNIYYEK